jgi:hypothetical protein
MDVVSFLVSSELFVIRFRLSSRGGSSVLGIYLQAIRGIG